MAVRTAGVAQGNETVTLERRLGVRKRARADAAAGRPRADEDGPCAFEVEIAAAVAAECEPILAERLQVAATLEQTLRRLQAPAPDFTFLASQALLPLQQVEARRRPDLQVLRARARAERADVDTFRRREDRVFGAKLP